MSELFNIMNIPQCVATPTAPAFIEKKELKEYVRKDTYTLGHNLRWTTTIEWKWNWRGKRKFIRFGKPILQYRDTRYDRETWYDVMTDNYTLLARHVD